jgi:hypothetical protein
MKPVLKYGMAIWLTAVSAMSWGATCTRKDAVGDWQGEYQLRSSFSEEIIYYGSCAFRVATDGSVIGACDGVNTYGDTHWEFEIPEGGGSIKVYKDCNVKLIFEVDDFSDGWIRGKIDKSRKPRKIKGYYFYNHHNSFIRSNSIPIALKRVQQR